MPTQTEVLDALRKVTDPELGRNLVELNMIHDLVIAPDGDVSFTIALTAPGCPLRDSMAANARAAVKNLGEVNAVHTVFRAMTDAERTAALGKAQAPQLPKLNAFNKIDRVIAVMSGKGGVGKSTVTAALAVALQRKGQKVGILDADITGPSIPRLFKLPSGGLRASDQGMLPAMTKKGIKVVSTNLLLPDEDLPVVWRGPMISATIRQFWGEALWGKLDTLLVDLPPGTSDAAMSVVQNLPLNGVVLVTTPQELAAMVVKKAVHMLTELKVPILGVVENMSYFRCPDCGHEHAIFGPSHVDRVAEKAGVPVWARLPIDPNLAELFDTGRAEEIETPEFLTLAEKLTIS
jgi:Mrp family chromosome partitioning ATPase